VLGTLCVLVSVMLITRTGTKKPVEAAVVKAGR
jgi:hypothetical protein